MGNTRRNFQVHAANVHDAIAAKTCRRSATRRAALTPPPWKARAVTELPTVANDCIASTWNIWNWNTSWCDAARSVPRRFAAMLQKVHAMITFTARVICTMHISPKSLYACIGCRSWMPSRHHFSPDLRGGSWNFSRSTAKARYMSKPQAAYCASVVASAAPARPHPNPKMNTQSMMPLSRPQVTIARRGVFRSNAAEYAPWRIIVTRAAGTPAARTRK
mmetsp:Transcript_41181/g.78646  ORF Transcript_41181/g.78646 Transcript_41181/m.78646 type:complete len:219 (-) Transcript_41181:1556-2212(-)